MHWANPGRALPGWLRPLYYYVLCLMTQRIDSRVIVIFILIYFLFYFILFYFILFYFTFFFDLFSLQLEDTFGAMKWEEVNLLT